MKRDVAGVGGEWRMGARNRWGLEMGGGDDKSTIGASLTPDFRNKEENNNNYSIYTDNNNYSIYTDNNNYSIYTDNVTLRERHCAMIFTACALIRDT